MRRVLLIYTLIGPITGAAVYVALSVAAIALGLGSNLFLPVERSADLAAALGGLGWRVGPALLITWLPALLTGLVTVGLSRTGKACPWWQSALVGGGISAVGGYALLALGAAYAPSPLIPPAIPGSLVIAVVGFVGTVPCWWVAYRNSAQKR